MKPIELDEFLSRTGLSKKILGFQNWNKVKRVISLRGMARIESVSAMPHEYLRQLLLSVGLAGDPSVKVFAQGEFRSIRIDPLVLTLGQKFVYRQNYVAILENFKEVFRGFSVPRGISKLTALIAIGRDNAGNHALAHYLPPIVEIHGTSLVLMDGVHRNFIVKNSGTTIESIVVEGVTAPFPCSAKSWDEIQVTDFKPANLEDRFFDLRPELFRDLKSIGIDG